MPDQPARQRGLRLRAGAQVTGPEALLEAFFRQRVRTLGGYTFKLAPTEPGVPDRLVLLPGGRVYLVELKTDVGRVSPAQVEWHKRAARLGTTVHVIYGRQGVLSWLRRVTEEHRENLLTAEKRARRDGLDRVT